MRPLLLPYALAVTAAVTGAVTGAVTAHAQPAAAGLVGGVDLAASVRGAPALGVAVHAGYRVGAAYGEVRGEALWSPSVDTERYERGAFDGDRYCVERETGGRAALPHCYGAFHGVAGEAGAVAPLGAGLLLGAGYRLQEDAYGGPYGFAAVQALRVGPARLAVRVETDGGYVGVALGLNGGMGRR